jgi:hypothetical protein
LLWQPLHLGNDRFFASFCIVFIVESPRCIWATSFEKVMSRQLSCLAGIDCDPTIVVCRLDALRGSRTGGGEA